MSDSTWSDSESSYNTWPEFLSIVCPSFSELERNYGAHFSKDSLPFVEGQLKLLSSLAGKSYTLKHFIEAIQRIITPDNQMFWQPTLCAPYGNGFLTEKGDLGRHAFGIFVGGGQKIDWYPEYLRLCDELRRRRSPMGLYVQRPVSYN
ncbi:hypothetical protein AJ78_07023 [Emergomyces pasteurianus Ep9510]|uniref:Uncharacterized protein n=1 Tax=Emergomyces pasteurianus Ep9510 TaxID=1447872 RepID=A0A1J9PWV8_9EURO|nr:hypothetical protein AJ78_07023 [Emergomyces pasteurianus Ep9510]